MNLSGFEATSRIARDTKYDPSQNNNTNPNVIKKRNVKEKIREIKKAKLYFEKVQEFQNKWDK